MKPKIDDTAFGSIVVAGTTYDHDIVIRLDGTLHKRKKKLSKQVYGTSHKISLQEIESVYEEGAERLIVGAGQYDAVRLSPEAEAFLSARGCAVECLPTPKAARSWNHAKGKVIALFHITC